MNFSTFGSKTLFQASLPFYNTSSRSQTEWRNPESTSFQLFHLTNQGNPLRLQAYPSLCFSPVSGLCSPPHPPAGCGLPTQGWPGFQRTMEKLMSLVLTPQALAGQLDQCTRIPVLLEHGAVHEHLHLPALSECLGPSSSSLAAPHLPMTALRCAAIVWW